MFIVTLIFIVAALFGSFIGQAVANSPWWGALVGVVLLFAAFMRLGRTPEND